MHIVFLSSIPITFVVTSIHSCKWSIQIGQVLILLCLEIILWEFANKNLFDSVIFLKHVHLQSLRTSVSLEEFKNCDFFSSQSTDSCQPVPARINEYFFRACLTFRIRRSRSMQLLFFLKRNQAPHIHESSQWVQIPTRRTEWAWSHQAFVSQTVSSW